MDGRTVITEQDVQSQRVRQQTFEAVQAEIAHRIKIADDSYKANKGSEQGLVAHGRLMELKGLAASLAWMAR